MHAPWSSTDPAEPNPNETMVVLRVDGERFEVSEAALQRFGSESMLVQAAAHEGEQLNWPFPAATFSKILEWANTGVLPQAGSLPQAEMTEVTNILRPLYPDLHALQSSLTCPPL